MTTATVHFIVGLPGSGKSTLVSELKKRYGDSTMVLNRDSVRLKLFGQAYLSRKPDREREAQVTALIDADFRRGLAEKRHLLVDETNLNPRFLFERVELVRAYGAEFEFIYLDVSVEEAKRRNRLRGKQGGHEVPEHVIDRMAEKTYGADGHLKEIVVGAKGLFFVERTTPGMKLIEAFNARAQESYPIRSRDVVIVDLDGTLAHNAADADRYLADRNRRNFPAFFRAGEHAAVNESVLSLLRIMRDEELTLMALSGRSDDYASASINFLERVGAPVSRLILKRQGDFRVDGDFKADAVTALQEEGYNIVHAVDDRPTSIRVFEERGILVSRVPFHESLGDEAGTYPEPQVDTVVGTSYCLRCGLDISIGIIHDTCRSAS